MNITSVAVVFGGFLGILLLQCAAAQTEHVVGGTLGWNVPQNGESAYKTWAASNKFVVGDVLIFNFPTNQRDVVEVPKESYDSCSSTNAISNTITTGPANITLSTPGDRYYICTIGRHCQLGQKLSITVSASPGALPPSTTTHPTPPPPSSSARGVFASFLLIFLSIVMGIVC